MGSKKHGILILKKQFLQNIISGMNKFHDVIDGGNGADTINLTSGSDLSAHIWKISSKLELNKDTFGKNVVEFHR